MYYMSWSVESLQCVEWTVVSTEHLAWGDQISVDYFSSTESMPAASWKLSSERTGTRLVTDISTRSLKKCWECDKQ